MPACRVGSNSGKNLSEELSSVGRVLQRARVGEKLPAELGVTLAKPEWELVELCKERELEKSCLQSWEVLRKSLSGRWAKSDSWEFLRKNPVGELGSVGYVSQRAIVGEKLPAELGASQGKT